ncbi:hypothetical protein STANM309S_03431 [Streptomyces tanashiensis]
MPLGAGSAPVAAGGGRRLSWFSILRHLLPDGVELVNLAVSGSTTTQALAQLPQLAFLRPTGSCACSARTTPSGWDASRRRRAPGW